MTDKKITQEQIIKALEICSSDAFNDSKERCTGCKYDGADKNLFCFEVLEKDALDLINRLKERNNRYLQKNTNQRNALAVLNKKVAEQKAEIERLQIRNKTLSKIVKNYDWKFAKAKIEAIKEFAERLKELSYLPNLSLTNMEVVDIVTINNLVKEMTE